MNLLFMLGKLRKQVSVAFEKPSTILPSSMVVVRSVDTIDLELRSDTNLTLLLLNESFTGT